MKIHVINKQTFDNLMNHHDLNDLLVEDMAPATLFISITDTDKFSESREPHFKEDHANVFNLSFDDCTEDGQPSPTQPSGTKMMSELQAEALWDFIKNNLNKEQCIVHCMAGISRSGAVGTFINDLVGGDYNTFKRMNPQVYPNQHVLGLLNKAKGNDLNFKK